ncbi:MAG: DUF4360 domain-containing protein [Oligoflexales bacterium]
MKRQHLRFLNQITLAITMVSSANLWAASAKQYISSIISGGNGCPQGSASTSVTGNLLTVFSDEMFAEGGPGILLSEGRKRCQIAISFVPGQKITVGVKIVEMEGDVTLTQGAKATIDSQIYLSGSPITGKSTKTFVGPVDKTFNLAASQITWLECKKAPRVNIAATAAVRALPQGEGTVTMNWKSVYQIIVKPCT